MLTRCLRFCFVIELFLSIQSVSKGWYDTCWNYQYAIDFEGCGNGMRDDVLARVLRRKPNVPSTLRCLSLAGCRLLTETGLAHVSDCDRLTDLNISGLCHVRDFGSLLPLTQLRSLNLSDCDELTDETIVPLLTTLTGLSELDISGCFKLTAMGLTRLISLPKLRGVSFTRSQKLSNKSLFTLGRIKQVQRLSLGWCSRITDIGLKRISQLPDLQELALLDCTELTYVHYSSEPISS
jgi:hypothetical protein